MQKQSSIQGIRALAILGIFLGHTIRILMNPEEFEIVHSIQLLGSSGVFTFFILSGYLFAFKGRIVEKCGFKDSLNNGWGKIKRLYPLHIITIIFAFFVRFPHTTNEWIWNIISLPFNLTLTQDLVPFVRVVNSFNGPSWFLSAYLWMWVLIFMFPRIANVFCGSSLHKCIKYAIVIIVIQTTWLFALSVFPFEIFPLQKEGYWYWLSYFNPVLCYSEFLLGCCVGRISYLLEDRPIQKPHVYYGYRRYLMSLSKSTVFILQILLLIASACCLFVLPSTSASLFFQPAIEVVTMLGILSVVCEGKSFGKNILSLKPLVWVGDLSANIFLIHGPVAILMGLLNFKYIHISPIFLFVIVWMVTIAISAFIDIGQQKVKRAYKTITNNKK